MIKIIKEYICFFIMLFVTLQESTDQCWWYLMFMFPPKHRSGVVITIRILQTRNEMWFSECKEESGVKSCRRASRLDRFDATIHDKNKYQQITNKYLDTITTIAVIITRKKYIKCVRKAGGVFELYGVGEVGAVVPALGPVHHRGVGANGGPAPALSADSIASSKN